ncbi:MAG: TlpA disulfide reductase family protein [Gammaproteobacteria bacterium]|nr:TlpA disulfide reductase family protein [Gammaproteobacteria bacterium]
MNTPSGVIITKESNAPSLNVLLDELGDFSNVRVDIPGDTAAAKELWLRKRVATLRSLIEHHPENEWIVPSLQELWYWHSEQPRLFMRVKDSFGQHEFKPTGLYQDKDESSSIESFQRDSEEMKRLEVAMADQFLDCHPDSQGSAWAYYVLLGNLETHLFDQLDDDSFEAERTRKDVLSTLQDRQEYRSRNSFTFEHESVRKLIEHYDEFDVDAALVAVDSFRNDEQAEQIAYLEQVRKLFPDNASIEEKYSNIRSLGQPFSLSFKDLLTDEYVDTRDYLGSVVLIDIWATWCKPCLAAVPFLRNFVNSHKHLGLKLVGLACDCDHDEEESPSENLEEYNFNSLRSVEYRVHECAVRHGMDWPIFVNEKFRDQWAISSIPRIFVVDRDGKLCWIAQDNSVFDFVGDLLNK